MASSGSRQSSTCARATKEVRHEWSGAAQARVACRMSRVACCMLHVACCARVARCARELYASCASRACVCRERRAWCRVCVWRARGADDLLRVRVRAHRVHVNDAAEPPHGVEKAHDAVAQPEQILGRRHAVAVLVELEPRDVALLVQRRAVVLRRMHERVVE
eukprot:6685514-Prymnesium_polylepis.1